MHYTLQGNFPLALHSTGGIPPCTRSDTGGIPPCPILVTGDAPPLQNSIQEALPPCDTSRTGGIPPCSPHCTVRMHSAVPPCSLLIVFLSLSDPSGSLTMVLHHDTTTVFEIFERRDQATYRLDSDNYNGCRTISLLTLSTIEDVLRDVCSSFQQPLLGYKETIECESSNLLLQLISRISLPPLIPSSYHVKENLLRN